MLALCLYLFFSIIGFIMSRLCHCIFGNKDWEISACFCVSPVPWMVECLSRLWSTKLPVKLKFNTGYHNFPRNRRRMVWMPCVVHQVTHRFVQHPWLDIVLTSIHCVHQLNLKQNPLNPQTAFWSCEQQKFAKFGKKKLFGARFVRTSVHVCANQA